MNKINYSTIQYTGDNFNEVKEFLGKHYSRNNVNNKISFIGEKGYTFADIGDYLIKYKKPLEKEKVEVYTEEQYKTLIGN